ncbi:cytidine deaminase [Motilibacter rhizosphaerae]|uniref:Cytidine deaminase n=1 Tax=Motilibacter rhizosphaerae TaxID=598652 RepID=A0A4Q7NRM9_9ACTN|nr:cytidine deaminase [Motilibacter rhizosphaerae]RZS89727.1 cytidine deaminase [Motilibacter rhizosphaerae]
MSQPDAPAAQTALDPEDAKLVTLARSARARLARPEGAAVRDGDGRTYLAATVELPSLRLSALQAAVAAAVSSGAATLEAAVVVGEAHEPSTTDLAAVADLAGADCPVILADARGRVVRSVRAGA